MFAVISVFRWLSVFGLRVSEEELKQKMVEIGVMCLDVALPQSRVAPLR